MHNLLTLNLTPALLDRRFADGTSFADAYARLTAANTDIHARLLSYKDQWPLGWLDFEKSFKFTDPIATLVKQGKKGLGRGHLHVFGIGGSALGTQAIYSCLRAMPIWEVRRKAPWQTADLHFIDNLHAPLQSQFFSLNVISKSGTTLETMAAFCYAREFWQNPFPQDHPRGGTFLVATTDANKGILHEWAEREGWPTLPVPDDVGGRFSVFTSVGLFPLAFAGVDIEALLDGAAAWQASAVESDLIHNEAWQLAALHYLLHTRGGANCAVQYIYGDPLLLLGDWFRQLWAESLAKRSKLDGTTGDGACLTPVVARGTTDQHSQNQLYMEGPDDKIYGFVTCEKWPEDPYALEGAGPSARPGDAQGRPPSGLDIPPELEYLRGRTFGELLEACRLGTRDALTELGRPVYEIILPELSERSIGAYMQMWMLATAYAGLLYNVNAFDQPGVEHSKQLAMERLLGDYNQ